MDDGVSVLEWPRTRRAEREECMSCDGDRGSWMVVQNVALE